MLKYSFAGLLLVCLGVLGPGCGGAEVGEACETVGATDECVDNAICQKALDSDPEPKCLMICKADSECAATEACNGTSGSSIKACRPK